MPFCVRVPTFCRITAEEIQQETAFDADDDATVSHEEAVVSRHSSRQMSPSSHCCSFCTLDGAISLNTVNTLVACICDDRVVLQDVLDLDGDGELNETETSLTLALFKEEVFENVKEKFKVTTK